MLRKKKKMKTTDLDQSFLTHTGKTKTSGESLYEHIHRLQWPACLSRTIWTVTEKNRIKVSEASQRYGIYCLICGFLHGDDLPGLHYSHFQLLLVSSFPDWKAFPVGWDQTTDLTISKYYISLPWVAFAICDHYPSMKGHSITFIVIYCVWLK